MHEPALGFGVEMNALNQCLDLVRKDSGRIGMRPLADRLCSCFADLLQPGAIVPETFKCKAYTAGRGGFGQEPVILSVTTSPLPATSAVTTGLPHSMAEIAPEPSGHGLPLSKCEAYNRVYEQSYGSS
jgi:hypothetical protein